MVAYGGVVQYGSAGGTEHEYQSLKHDGVTNV
jgi:hypothetical protein